MPLFALVALILTGALGPVHDTGAAPRQRGGVTTLTGTVTVTSPFLLESRTDPYVLLRDLSLTTEKSSPGQQVLAGVDGDVAEGATYTLNLPIAPSGGLMDVDNGEGEGDGVQVFWVQLVSDAIGDPFFGPLEESWGAPVISVKIDYDSFAWTGRLVIWAPDDEQYFPVSAGKDGVLFTRDDPVEPVEAGWTVVDLNGRFFDFERAETVEVPLHEADDAHTDLSDLGYVEAFDALVEDLRNRYAFKDVKVIDFDAIVDEIRPQIVEAEREEDPGAYHVAMMGFAKLFGDGHVGVSLRSEYFDNYLTDRWGGALGLTIGETDEGEVVVVSVANGSPADAAGIEPGAVLLKWDGDPIDEALDQVDLMRGWSSPHGLRYQQLQLLPRMPTGKMVTLKLRNPDARKSVTVDVEAVADPQGLQVIRRRWADNPAELPVTASVLPSGIGYIRVNTFMSEVALMFDSWEWAMEKMIELDVPALIIDVRGNGGGWGHMATFFAGSFTDERFVLAREFAADDDGEFQPAGTTDVQPSPIQWDKPVAVLIDAGCASACEIFSAAMAHDPDHVLVGTTPTAGVEAGVLPWNLPDDLYFQASIYLMLDGDGEVFLEGVGVPPTIDVEVTFESLSSPEDEVLLAADAALLEQL